MFTDQNKRKTSDRTDNLLCQVIQKKTKGRGIGIINARMKKKTSDITHNLALVGRSQGFDKVGTIEVRTK